MLRLFIDHKPHSQFGQKSFVVSQIYGKGNFEQISFKNSFVMTLNLYKA